MPRKNKPFKRVLKYSKFAPRDPNKPKELGKKQVRVSRGKFAWSKDPRLFRGVAPGTEVVVGLDEPIDHALLLNLPIDSPGFAVANAATRNATLSSGVQSLSMSLSVYSYQEG